MVWYPSAKQEVKGGVGRRLDSRSGKFSWTLYTVLRRREGVTVRSGLVVVKSGRGEIVKG